MKHPRDPFALALLLLLLPACSVGGGVEGRPGTEPGEAASGAPPPETQEPETVTDDDTNPTRETATLGAGCFWCVEAVLEQLDGVQDVRSGYMGGHVENPTYREVCGKETGHAEVVQVDFDPSVLPYEDLLDWFWRLHDPTTPNRQGADVGPQYRSAIFVHSAEQREVAERSREQAQASFPSPIVTEITDASTFWEAEDDHQDYYRENTEAGYCRVVIRPKLKKLGLKE